MKRVAVITATRAEFGILTPLLVKLNRDKFFELNLIVTGTHLLEEYGMTIKEIEKTEIPIYKTIEIVEKGSDAFAISKTMANGITKFAKFYKNERIKGKPYDLLIVLGDRTETLSFCIAAMNEKIPIAHLHGGERTEGAVDESVRHAITKMSHIHFTVNEIYRKRVIQLGEQPTHVYNVGALGVENVLHEKLLDRETLCKELKIDSKNPYVMVTFHPVTLSKKDVDKEMEGILFVMNKHSNYEYIITKANDDVGGEEVNGIWERYIDNHKNAHLFASLGMTRYLSAVKYATMVLGNSSSGIIEAPSFHVPTVNIGERQKGRLSADSVIHCKNTKAGVENGFNRACLMSDEHRNSKNPYGDGNTSERIMGILKKEFEHGSIEIQKNFYDL